MTAVILDGIVLGLAFGLLGVGMTLVYGLGGVLNLAYGQIVVLAAIVASIVVDDGPADTRRRRSRRPGGRRRRRPPRPHVDAAGVSRARPRSGRCWGCCSRSELHSSSAACSRGATRTVRLYINITGEPVSILGVPMTRGSIWASAMALAVAALLLLFFGATTFGRGVRSVIQDEVGARLVGINPRFVRTVIFALSGALAGIVAMANAMVGPLTVNAGFELTSSRSSSPSWAASAAWPAPSSQGCPAVS